jgi:hypothetical protein
MAKKTKTAELETPATTESKKPSKETQLLNIEELRNTRNKQII